MQHRLRDKGRNLFNREATMTRLVRHAVHSILVLFLVPALVSAEVSRVEITSRRDAAGGRSFGSAGTYERVAAKRYLLREPGTNRTRWQLSRSRAPKIVCGKLGMCLEL